MNIGYPDTKNKKGSGGPLLNREEDQYYNKVLPDPKVTKPKVARELKRRGEITKEEFKTYKKQRKEYGTKKKPVITSGDPRKYYVDGKQRVKGEGGPNENFNVAVPRRKWDKKVRKEKRSYTYTPSTTEPGVKVGKRDNKKWAKAKAYEEKIVKSAPRVVEYKKIPKSQRTAEELKYHIDTRKVPVSDTKKAARKRYRKYKKQNK